MEAATLAREGSSIPVSTHQSESAVLPLPASRAWAQFKGLKLEDLVPGKVKATTWVTGGHGQLDSTLKIDYQDGASWTLRVLEISDIRRSIGYEVIAAEPAHSVSSILGQIVIRPVTEDNTTFVEWITDFSNDADAAVITDQKYKKLEFFTELRKNIVAYNES